MLSLDDKLYDILCPDIDGPINSVEQIEAAVAQIKQAISDAGYVKVEDDIEVKDNVIRIRDLHLMTGQEWYDRLTAEIGDITPETARQILESHGAAGIYTYVIEAARRASGINEKETN